MEASREDRGGSFWSRNGSRAGPLVRLFFAPKSANQIESDLLNWDAGLADSLWSAAGKVNLNAPFLKAFLEGMGTASLLLVVRLATGILERRNAAACKKAA